MEKENKYNSGLQLILVFEKKWSGSSQIMEPIFNKLQKEFKELIVLIDLDKNTDFGKMYSIRKVPTIIFVNNGMVTETISGIFSYKALLNKIKIFKKQ